MILLFLGSSLTHLEPELGLFEVWELMPLAMMMICRTFISQTSNSSSSSSRRAKEEPKKGKSSKYNFQDDGHIGSGRVAQVQLQEGSNVTSKNAKNRRLR